MALAPAHSCRLFRAFSLFPPLEKIQTDAQPRRIYRIAFVRHDLVYFPIGRNQFPLRDSQYKERSAAVNTEKEISVREQHEHIDDRKNYEHHNVHSCNLIIFDLF